MSAQHVIAQARYFLDLLNGSLPVEKSTLENLAIALDRLALAYHHSSGVAPVSDEPAEPPPRDYKGMCELALRAFPDLGFYACVKPMPDATEITMADAIDDVADIACDLRDVV